MISAVESRLAIGAVELFTCNFRRSGYPRAGDWRAHRCRQLAGVEPETVTINGDDPIALVVSLNVRRRNLTTGQKAVAAAEAWDQVEKVSTRRNVPPGATLAQ